MKVLVAGERHRSDQAHLHNRHRTATPQLVWSGSVVDQVEGEVAGSLVRSVEVTPQGPSAKGWKRKGESETRPETESWKRVHACRMRWDVMFSVRQSAVASLAKGVGR